MSRFSRAFLALAIAGSLISFVPRVASAQHITVDGRFSPAQTLVGPNYSISANLGKQVGSNLFHSFGQFGLATGESAAFSGPTPVNNVIGRVTGGNMSSIDGKIQSKIAGANLYLINPSGIVFGPNATVNVSGSFHASTADYLKMSDGAKFQATNPDASTLSAAPPATFGFLTTRPAAITVNGSTLGPVRGTLGLVGGPVSITGATLSAPAGTIHVTSAAGAGEVAVDPRNTSASTVTSFGPVAVRGGSQLDVSNPSGLGSGGSVFIRSGALTVDASEINADNYGSAAGGQIVLRGEDQVSLANAANVHALTLTGGGAGVTISTAAGGAITASDSTVLTGSVGPGNAGPLSVSAGQLMLTNGAILGSSAAGIGGAGTVMINAGSMSIGSNGEISSSTVGPGHGGDVSIKTGALAIADGTIVSETSGPGNGGNINIDVTTDLSLIAGAAGFARISTTSFLPRGSRFSSSGNAGNITVDVAGKLSLNGGESGIAIITADTLATTGNGGNVTVRAGSLNIVSGGQISSDTGFGRGRAGRISVTVDGELSIDGGSQAIAAISSISGSSSGDAGILAVTARDLRIINGGQIATSTLGAPPPAGSGNAGVITANVANSLMIDGTKTPTGITGIRSDAREGSTGNAGQVTVTTGTLSIANNGSIVSNTFGPGKGGSVVVTVDDQLMITGVPGGSFTGIAANAQTGRTGDAGRVMVHAGTLVILHNGEIAGNTFGSGNGGSVSVNVTGQLTIDGASADTNFITGIDAQANRQSTGNAGQVTVTTGTLSIANNGSIVSNTFGPGKGGSVVVAVDDQLMITGVPGGSFTGIAANAQTGRTGDAGSVMVHAGTLVILHNGEIAGNTFGSGNGGSVSVNVTGQLTIDGASADTNFITGIDAEANRQSTGNAGQVTVTTGTLSIANNGSIVSNTFGPGKGSSVVVTVDDQLMITGVPGGSFTGIAANAQTGRTGDAGSVMVHVGTLVILHNGEIAGNTFGSGNGGSVSVNVTGQLTIDGASADTNFITGIDAQANRQSTGNAGQVTVTTGTLSIANNGSISVRTQGSGAGGDLAVTVAGLVALSSGAQVIATTTGAGNGGTVQVTTQGPLSLVDPGTGIIASATTTASGNAGSAVISAPQITVTQGAEIASTTAGTGAGGSVDVRTPGALVLDGGGIANTQIAASATGLQSGPGGSVTVQAGSLTVEGGAQIASSTAGPGKGGDVDVRIAGDVTLSGVAADGSASGITAAALPGSSGQAGQAVLTAGGPIALSGGAKAASSTAGSGDGGTVQVTAQGPLTLTDPGTGITASAERGSSGNAGSVIAAAPQISIASGAEIASSTAGTGMGGSVTVTTPGMLVLDGAGLAGNTEIAASATGTQSGPGGSVKVAADALAIEGGARIASTTFGPGKAGDIAVTVANGVTLSGTGPTGASGITAAAQGGSSGQAGEVILIAGGGIALSGGSKVTSSTAGSGNGGTVEVTAKGPLSLSDPGSGIIASATSTASGNAGSVTVGAPQIALISGAEIASATAGTGAGGSVRVTTPGALALNGNGDANTEIAASAAGPHSGPGGAVTVAASALTVEGGAQIASSTAGPG